MDPTLNRNEEKKYIYILGIKLDLINHYFKLEFVDPGLYFVVLLLFTPHCFLINQDENNFIKSVVSYYR